MIYHCNHSQQHSIYLLTIKRQNVSNGEAIYTSVLQQILSKNQSNCMTCIVQLMIKITISSTLDSLKLLFSINSLAKLLLDGLLSDSLLLNSSISQSHSKLWFKSTNHNLVASLSVLESKFSLSHLGHSSFLGNYNFYDQLVITLYVIQFSL